MAVSESANHQAASQVAAAVQLIKFGNEMHNIIRTVHLLSTFHASLCLRVVDRGFA